MKLITLLLFTGLVYIADVYTQPIAESYLCPRLYKPVCGSGIPSAYDSCECPKIYRPVCGSDGKIYNNDCLLNCENKRREKLGLPLICNLGDYTGAPPTPSEECICPAIYKPVYGSDGKIYDNECLLNCENRRREKLGLPLISNLGDYTGAPPTPSEECICPAIYKPVYGSDGKIYNNDCLLNCENKRREKLGLPLICNLGDYTGAPPTPSEECICPAIYKPVYGSDGKIYDNDCLLNCENRRREKLGLPLICNLGDYTGAPPTPSEECICPAIYKPVCGSDGKIYNNDCLLNCENKRREKLGLPLICNLGDYTGAPPTPSEECICPAIYKPVYGSDGKIYDNECLLNCENRRREKLGLPLISNLGDYTGAPPTPSEECICPAIYKPVYGSDGKIYNNDCLLNCENKRREKLGLPLICNLGDYTGAPPTPSEECICPAIYKPVYGSDGKIYDNDCLLNCENRRREKLGLPLICNLGDYTGAPPTPSEECICPAIYKPVYGSDGKIYNNDCLLNCENKRREKLGLPLIRNLGDYTGTPPTPSEECICPAIYKPVYGSDGKIYNNECLLNCENRRREKLGLPLICNLGDYTGAPPTPSEECICPAIYKPVYGSDGKIYDNDCLLNCENRRREKLGLPLICNLGDYTGAPPTPSEECICPAIYKPVYGSDGKIYDNDCLLNCENRRREKLGLPLICNLGDYTGAPPTPSEECICPAIYKPVYGSDGKIYDNDCLLNCENRRREKLGLPLICNLGDYTGAPPTSSEECICPAIYKPVYGSDGKIYDNECLLNCENRRREKLGLPLICNLGDYSGAPPTPSEDETCICPFLYRPVCGSDGKIYSNACELDCENKRRQKLGLPTICNLGDYNPPRRMY